MRKIWNGLRYGDFQTRKSIGSVIGFSVAAAVCIVIAGLRGQIMLFVVAMILAVIAIIISQTFTLEDEDFVAEVNHQGEKESVRAVMAQKKSAAARRNAHGTEPGHMEDEISEHMTDKQKERREKENTYQRYSEQELKRVKRRYHVRKDHRPIMIDYSKSYRIKECPAFIWRVHNKVYLLLIEKEPRRICISRDLIRHMGYQPGVRVNMEDEYVAFRKENLVTNVFREYLPDYTESRNHNDPLRMKNLYTIYPDIWLTNRSAYAVMDLLCLHFMPKDKITESEQLNGFFKRIYAANILYRDRVYSIMEYKDSIEQALRDMCYAKMPEREFNTTLEQLVKGRLISDEYANYYREIRRKHVGD